jgi:hypothetical protein
VIDIKRLKPSIWDDWETWLGTKKENKIAHQIRQHLTDKENLLIWRISTVTIEWNFHYIKLPKRRKTEVINVGRESWCDLSVTTRSEEPCLHDDGRTWG